MQLPFELEVVEAALLEATWQLEQRLAGLGPRVQALYDMQKRRGAKAITNEARRSNKSAEAVAHGCGLGLLCLNERMTAPRRCWRSFGP